MTAADAFETVDAAPRDVRFAAAVATFGQLLRGGRYTGEYGYADVVDLAQGARGEDPFGYAISPMTWAIRAPRRRADLTQLRAGT